jgi:hypothetical protein
MVKNDPVDLEKLFFHLIENTYVNPYQERRYGKNDIKRDDDEIERIYNNYMSWAKKIFNDLPLLAAKQQNNLSKKIKWVTISKEKKGLDSWM